MTSQRFSRRKSCRSKTRRGALRGKSTCACTRRTCSPKDWNPCSSCWPPIPANARCSSASPGPRAKSFSWRHMRNSSSRPPQPCRRPRTLCSARKPTTRKWTQLRPSARRAGGSGGRNTRRMGGKNCHTRPGCFRFLPGLLLHGNDVDRLVTADGFEVEEDEEINRGHGSGDKGVSLERSPITFYIGFNRRGFSGRSLAGANFPRSLELLTVNSAGRLKEQPLAWLRGFELGIGRRNLGELFAREPVLGVAQARRAHQPRGHHS